MPVLEASVTASVRRVRSSIRRSGQLVVGGGEGSGFSSSGTRVVLLVWGGTIALIPSWVRDRADYTVTVLIRTGRAEG